jgi:Fasciclin domain
VSFANFLRKNPHYRPYTVFAPTNDGFAYLSPDTVAFLMSPEGRDQLILILQYHVTLGNLYSSLFTDGEIPMLNGETATLVVGPPVMIENAMVVGDQILAANGVIHPIDEVLVLPTQATAAAAVLVTAEPVTPALVTAAPVAPVTAAPLAAEPVTPALVTAAPVVPVTAAPLTALPVTALPVTMPPASLPLTQPPASAVPGDSMVVVIGAQEAPAPAPLPMLEVVDSESKDDNDKDDKDDNDATAGMGECQGDCKYNADCATGLVCVNSKGLTAIPGCQGTPLDGKLVSLGSQLCVCMGRVRNYDRYSHQIGFKLMLLFSKAWRMLEEAEAGQNHSFCSRVIGAHCVQQIKR